MGIAILAAVDGVHTSPYFQDLSLKLANVGRNFLMNLVCVFLHYLNSTSIKLRRGADLRMSRLYQLSTFTECGICAIKIYSRRTNSRDI